MFCFLEDGQLMDLSNFLRPNFQNWCWAKPNESTSTRKDLQKLDNFDIYAPNASKITSKSIKNSIFCSSTSLSITAYVLFLGRWTIDGFIDFFESKFSEFVLSMAKPTYTQNWVKRPPWIDRYDKYKHFAPLMTSNGPVDQKLWVF